MNWQILKTVFLEAVAWECAAVVPHLIYDLLPPKVMGVINFTAPAGVTTARIIFWKPAGNRSFRFDNVSVELDNTTSIEQLRKFDFEFYPNPVKPF